MGKYRTARQATDNNMAHAQRMPDNYGYKHKLIICNTYCFSTVTMTAIKSLNVTLYLCCLSFLFNYALGAAQSVTPRDTDNK